MPRYRLLLAYEGSDYAGWWRQADRPSIATSIDAACDRLGETGARVVGAARTDAGVHARGQVGHLDCQRDWEPTDLADRLAGQLPPTITCLAAAATPTDWHAVHASCGKTYSYEIDVSRRRNPLRHRFAWRPPRPPSLDALQAWSDALLGRHDWRAFARRGDHRDDHVATVQRFGWATQDERLIATITADRFIYRLARSLVGAVVAGALGSYPREELDLALAGAASRASDYQAPAQGLCLREVHYPEALAWEG